MKSDRVGYLFASPASNQERSSSTVFYKVHESLAGPLCELFTKEYGDERLVFHSEATTTFTLADQVLLDEELGWLDVYGDPDRFVYDPPPPNELHRRAQYAVRARQWERLLEERTGVNDGNADSSNAEAPPATDGLPELSAVDRRNSGLIVLLLLAQAYYKLLESSTSVGCAALDLELNESYLWTVTCITNLLRNHEDLRDFPIPFEPLFPDLYPSTIRDIDWEDMVAPHADRFLSTVQQYVMSRGPTEPVENSAAWALIELMRGNVQIAVARADTYYKRMRQHLRQMYASERSPAKTAANTGTARSDTVAKSREAERTTPDTVAQDQATGRTKIFVSYSHKDSGMLEELKTMLAPAIRDNKVDLWDDTMIQAGEEWRKKIRAAIDSAKVALLLVSQHFLASEFIAKNELPPLLSAAKQDGVTIFWICLSACLHEQTPIESYQAAHDVSKPLDHLRKPDRQETLKRICSKLIQLAEST